MATRSKPRLPVSSNLQLRQPLTQDCYYKEQRDISTLLPSPSGGGRPHPLEPRPLATPRPGAIQACPFPSEFPRDGKCLCSHNSGVILGSHTASSSESLLSPGFVRSPVFTHSASTQLLSLLQRLCGPVPRAPTRPGSPAGCGREAAGAWPLRIRPATVCLSLSSVRVSSLCPCGDLPACT